MGTNKKQLELESKIKHIYVSTQKIKYLGVTLTKHMQELYDEYWQSLMNQSLMNN